MKHKYGRCLLGVLLAISLLLCGCEKTDSTLYPLEDLTQTMESSLKTGHFFFAGKVTAAGINEQMISYYEEEAENNTFYQVEVTEDFFGCMPEEAITVCIFGTTGNFTSRTNLEEGKEYLFDTTLWVHGEEAVFLLPSFYLGMPQRSGETLYYTEAGQMAAVDGSFTQYKQHLSELAAKTGYTAESVLAAVTAQLETAVEKDAAYFEELSFEEIDTEHLETTTGTAQTLLAEAKETEPSWEAIRGILQ
ncbi:MAG: hypothetical protein IJ333_05365 [Clostridia bacterium]|nr:hypothetical protein [Clostridia bacterium]